MDNHLEQVVQYIKQGQAAGHDYATIVAQLVQSGWPQNYIDQAFGLVNSPTTPPAYTPNQPVDPRANPNTPVQSTAPDHRVRTGVLWMAAPFISLFLISVMQVLLRATGVDLTFINAISILLGVASVIFIPVGIIVGILKLTRH